MDAEMRNRIVQISICVMCLCGLVTACGARIPRAENPTATITPSPKPPNDDPLLAYARAVVSIRERTTDLTASLLNWQSFETNRSLDTFQPLVDRAQRLDEDIQTLNPPPQAEAYQQALESYAAELLQALDHQREFVRTGNMEQYQVFLDTISELAPRRSIFFADLDSLLEDNGIDPEALSTPEGSSG